MPQTPIRIGIIGFGRIGAEHATWLARANRVQPVAVADVTPARADLARQRKLRVYTSVEQLLGDRGVDAVLVGETLMRSADLCTAVQNFARLPRQAR